MLTRLQDHRVTKPWGRRDVPRPFNGGSDGGPLGEIWFQRDGGYNDALLVKYLFTSERLSVQVHPGDAAARRAGHRRGKDEAWLVIDAEPEAELGIGLKQKLRPAELRASALDGSIVEKLDWRPAAPGDAYYSPAGTLHSIGAGLILLEIQQNADITYRLYDFGRPRELHLDEGVSAAKTDAKVVRSSERPLGRGRSILVAGPKFIVERWRSPAAKELQASRDEPLWLIPLRGPVRAGDRQLEQPSVWIMEGPAPLEIGPGAELLVAYEGSAVRDLA